MALFAVQVADCTALISANQQTMSCCGSMACHPSHGFHECCKAKVSPQLPTILPRDHGASSPSVVSAVAHLPAADITAADAAYSQFAAPQHSPPELYTLHSSFRI